MRQLLHALGVGFLEIIKIFCGIIAVLFCFFLMFGGIAFLIVASFEHFLGWWIILPATILQLTPWACILGYEILDRNKYE